MTQTDENHVYFTYEINTFTYTASRFMEDLCQRGNQKILKLRTDLNTIKLS